jgi:hypothetical protein
MDGPRGQDARRTCKILLQRTLLFLVFTKYFRAIRSKKGIMRSICNKHEKKKRNKYNIFVKMA